MEEYWERIEKQQESIEENVRDIKKFFTELSLRLKEMPPIIFTENIKEIRT